MRRNTTRLDTWLTLASVAITLVAVALSFFTFRRFSELVANADLIQTPAVFADLFDRGGSFVDWHIAPAPAIVPEYGMFALAYLVGGTYVGRILAYALIQVLVFWAALYGLSWAAGLRRPLVIASLAVSVMGLFAMLRVMNFMQLVMSAIHFGGFILQIVALALIVMLWRGWATRSRRASIALIAGIGALSLVASLNDALYVVQLAGPVCLVVVVGILLRRIPWRSGISFAAVLGLSSLVGWQLYSRVMPNPARSSGTVDLDEVSTDFDGLVLVWGEEFSKSPIAPAIVIVAVALGIVGAYLLVSRRNVRWMRGTTLQALAVFALISGTLPLVAAFVSAAGTTPRYALPLFYWPCILIAMILTQLDWRRAMTVAVALACVASLASMTFAIRDVIRFGLQDSYYTSTTSCLDEAAAKYGVEHAIGTYWIAKPTQEFSRTGLTVTVLTGNLKQRNWVSSAANVYPAYDAFIDRKSEPSENLRRTLIKRFGKPANVVTCGGVKMFVWSPGALRASSEVTPSVSE
jgi:hypothetical protein